MRTQTKAWLNKNGSPKSLDELKEISQNWSIEKWEDYAKSLEACQREDVLENPTQIEQFSNEENAFISMGEITHESYPRHYHLKQVMLEEMEQLSRKQRELIELIYQKELNFSQAARVLGVCRSTVIRNHKRLLEKLKAKILMRTHSLNVEKFLREVAA